MQTISSFDISLSTFAMATGLFGAALLLGDRGHRRTSWGLALFLAVAAFDRMEALLVAWGLSPGQVWLAMLEPLVTSLYGPSIYLYVLTMTGKTPARGRVALLLCAPCLVALVMLGLAANLPAPVQLAMLRGDPVTDPAFAGWATTLMLGMQVTFLTITFGFLVASWRALEANLRVLPSLFFSTGDRTLAWLRWVMALTVAAWAWAAVEGLLSASGSWLSENMVDAAITVTLVSLLAYFGVRQRPDDAPSAPKTPAVPEKYARSALDDARMKRLGERMLRLMRDEALYRDPALSLRRLADRVGASANHVSQTLNTHLGVNFFDFVNGQRVDEAERLLHQTDQTVTEIALEVGFNSRSTFNTAFQKHRGTAPTTLRQQLSAAARPDQRVLANPSGQV